MGPDQKPAHLESRQKGHATVLVPTQGVDDTLLTNDECTNLLYQSNPLVLKQYQSFYGASQHLLGRQEILGTDLSSIVDTMVVFPVNIQLFDEPFPAL